MLANFRDRYPLGSIITALQRVEEGIYVVSAQAVVNGIVLGSGIAGSTTVEEAEDAAIQRALRVAGLDRASSFTSPAAMVPALTAVSPPVVVSAAAATTNGGGANGGIYGAAEEESWDSPPSAPSTAPAAPVKKAPPPPPELPSLDMEDLSDLIAQTDVELTRIGWGPKEGRKFLKERFGKQSRQQLDDRELREFLSELQNHPTRRATDTAEAF